MDWKGQPGSLEGSLMWVNQQPVHSHPTYLHQLPKEFNIMKVEARNFSIPWEAPVRVRVDGLVVFLEK